MLAMGTVHLPAWQKLGLKLKNQFPQASIDTPNSEASSRKRKFSQDHGVEIDSHNGIKRQQIAVSNEPGASFNSLRASSTGSESFTSSDSRRKSVTFTADTKVEDGSSSKRLVQAAYASRLAQMDQVNGSVTSKLQNGQPAKTKGKKQAHTSSVAQMEKGIASATEELQDAMAIDSAGNDKTKDAAETIATTPSKTEDPTQSKRLKKPSAQPSSKVEAARQKKRQGLAIQYLDQYANARATWKFNKKRQNTILKMALEADSIPTKHDEALKSYLEGLQSTALRHELRSKAREILAQESDAAGSTSTNTALVSRAELVLEALGQEPADVSHDDKPSANLEMTSTAAASPSKPEVTAVNGLQTSPKPNGSAQPNPEINGTSKKRRRRRAKKRRNTSPSSSDSDSSSSSDESGD